MKEAERVEERPKAAGARKVSATVLVVDDEAYVRESLATLLGRRGFDARTAGGYDEALGSGSLDGVDAVVTDLKMPGKDGTALLRRLSEVAPRVPVIVLTGHGTVPSAVECLKIGAADYLLKPVDPDELLVVLERALGRRDLEREIEFLRSTGDRAGDGRGGAERGGPPRPLGESESWRQVLAMAEMVAPTDTAVLLLGESGTGKEEVAKYVHRLSRRAAAPFVPVNCAAIPTELFESEFFGHKRGSFTGALEDRDGRFKVAHRGTLFLDEVNSLPPVAQAKVLRVLQDGRFERVGDSRPTAVDVRVMSASNSDLSSEVEAGRFRADLFYRINVMTIHLSPLRERREDVPVLAEAFLRELAVQLGKPLRGISRDALAALQAYDWPGNVRELRNVLERGVVLEPGPELRAVSLPTDVVRSAENGPDLNLRASLQAEERRLLETALERAGGVRRRAAEMLGVDERNMSYFLKKHGLNGK
ncbi:MAG TPA: sigma-54 dependent transcriptional regulator [Thermoanaerobaculia bacterium]|nr:sigma-54 dependent transcriptional regulator [Thermoanaerobaculia bacterium]